jgi:nucleoside diphosphate kinase
MMEKNKKDEIVQKILERGFKIADQREVKFTEEMAREFYKEKKDSVIIFDDIT